MLQTSCCRFIECKYLVLVGGVLLAKLPSVNALMTPLTGSARAHFPLHSRRWSSPVWRAHTPRRGRVIPLVRRHRAVRVSGGKMGPACARRNVRACDVLRGAVRCIPELRAGTVRLDRRARGGSTLVRLVLHQGAPLLAQRPTVNERTRIDRHGCLPSRPLLSSSLVADKMGNICYGVSSFVPRVYVLGGAANPSR